MIFVLSGDVAGPGGLHLPAPEHGTGNDYPAQNERQQKDHHQAISCRGDSKAGIGQDAGGNRQRQGNILETRLYNESMLCSCCKPWMVALTTLCGLLVPMHLVKIF